MHALRLLSSHNPQPINMISSTGPQLRPQTLISQTRSSSMPSRSSYPLILQLNDHFHTLKIKHNDSTSSTSSLSSIAQKLQNLDDLYDCIDDLLISPRTHHVFAREHHEKWVREILDGYLGLVDACATAKDLVFQSKEFVSKFLSVVRRRRDSDDHLSELTSSRKITKKMIQRSLTNVRAFKNKSSSSALLASDKDHETAAIISMLREAESTTLELIEELLFSVAGTKSHPRPSGWSLVSRLMPSRKVISCRDQKNTTLEFGDLDDALCRLVSVKASSGMRIDDQLQQKLRDMDLTIGVVEDKLEGLFKRLIRSRVSLLNMQSQL